MKIKKGNFTNKLLALFFISLVWIPVLGVGVLLALLFGTDGIFVRTILLFPFSFIGVIATLKIWDSYSNL